MEEMQSTTMGKIPVQSKPYKVTIVPKSKDEVGTRVTLVRPVLPVLPVPKAVMHQMKLPIRQLPIPRPTLPASTNPGCLLQIVNSSSSGNLTNLANSSVPRTETGAPVASTLSKPPPLVKIIGINEAVRKETPVPQTLFTFTGSIGAISSSKMINESTAPVDQYPKAHLQTGQIVATANAPIVIQNRAMPVKDLLPTRLNCLQLEKAATTINSSSSVLGKELEAQEQLAPVTRQTVTNSASVDIVTKATTVQLVPVSEPIAPGTIIAKIPFLHLKQLQTLRKTPVLVSGGSSDNKSRSILIRKPSVMSVQEQTTASATTPKEMPKVTAPLRIQGVVPIASVTNSGSSVTHNATMGNGDCEVAHSADQEFGREEMVVQVSPEVTLIRKPRDSIKIGESESHEEKPTNGVGEETLDKLPVTSEACTTFEFGRKSSMEECQEEATTTLPSEQVNCVNDSSNSNPETNDGRLAEPTKDVGDNSQGYDLKRLKCTETITSSLEESSIDLLDKQQYSDAANFVVPEIKREPEEDHTTLSKHGQDVDVLEQNGILAKAVEESTTNSKSGSVIEEEEEDEESTNQQNHLPDSEITSNSIVVDNSNIVSTSTIETINKEQEKQSKEAVVVKESSDSDDDVTILPTEPALNEPIEIEDEDGEEEAAANVIDADADADADAEDSRTSTPESRVTTSKNSSKSGKEASTSAPLNYIDRWQAELKQKCVGLKWQDRLGVARGSNLRFEMNEFNFIQMFERCPERTQPYNVYEKPIFERNPTQLAQDDQFPLLYLCRRCNFHGPATDFLAPEFCSMACLKRHNRKYSREHRNHTSPQKRTKKVEKVAKIEAAPISLFAKPFPTTKNNFKVGMKLEAIDPENLSLFCVCTVVEIKGFRLKLNFDGFDSMYDFWVNADSTNIFPPGWCTVTKRALQPPRHFKPGTFNWFDYLQRQEANAAPRSLFPHLLGTRSPAAKNFKIGMHLEAEDLNDTGKLCVASVADIVDNRIRVHFDGWDDCYDIMVDINSPYIHPCGWHVGRQQLVVPPECENMTFSWNDYIKKKGNGPVATADLFTPRPPNYFRPQMRLEVVDPRNPSLIRTAIVVTHKAHRIKLCLEGWTSEHCFWLEDDNCNIHPVGWCEATGHPLEPLPKARKTPSPSACPTQGCNGLGNALHPELRTHSTRGCCPYWLENWRQMPEKPVRLPSEQVIRSAAVPISSMVEEPPAKPKIRVPSSSSSSATTTSGQQSKKANNNSSSSRHIMNSLPVTTMGSHYLVPLSPECNLSEESGMSVPPAINVAQEFLIDYGPRLQQNYDLWRNHFNINPAKVYCNPLHWTTAETADFVRQLLNSEEAARPFIREDIDGTAFLLLQQNDLMEQLAMKMGPAVKLHSAILQLRILAITKFKVPCSSPKKVAIDSSAHRFHRTSL